MAGFSIAARERLERDLAAILWHTLGISPSSTSGSYRNYYAAEPDHSNWEKLQRLVQMGLMVQYKSVGGGQVFAATPKGQAVAAEERLLVRQERGIKVWDVHLRRDPDRAWAGTGQGKTRSAARYEAWLRLRDALPDLQLVDVEVGRLVPTITIGGAQ